MHGSKTPPHLTGDPAREDPRARRIATLSAEYLDAGSSRREAISDEIAALIDGRVTPLRR